MNEQLPYEDDLFKRLGELPLPGEDMAWEDMKRRLDRDDDTPVIPPRLKGCGLYALLLVLLLVIACLFIADPAKWFHHPGKKEPVAAKNIENKKQPAGIARVGKNDERPANISTGASILPSDTSFTAKNALPSTQLPDTTGGIKQMPEKATALSNNGKKQPAHTVTPIRRLAPRSVFIRVQKSRSADNDDRQQLLSSSTKGSLKSRISHTEAAEAVTDDTLHNNNVVHPPAGAADTVITLQPKGPARADSIKKKAATDAANNRKGKNDSLGRQKIWFSSGLALHQLLPVAGQKTNPYNSLGRKSSLGDYIPSVYLRMYKEKKWFLQAEFTYGAPQYTRQVLFNQKKIVDTGTASTITTNSSIKKTFYHQLPLSFNYFVLPGFSIGAGFTINKFRSALVEQDVHKTGNLTQIDSLVSSGLVSQKKADSNFVTTYVQALFEAQYQWKRLAIGTRYSFGLQPYLKFQLPGGQQRQEKNSALQVFIRYELWRSRK